MPLLLNDVDKIDIRSKPDSLESLKERSLSPDQQISIGKIRDISSNIKQGFRENMSNTVMTIKTDLKKMKRETN